MSLKAMLDKRSKGQAFLKASDVAEGVTSVTIIVAGTRETPENFDAPLIIDFKTPIYGKPCMVINRTNTKMLMKMHGDDENQLVGKKIRLDIVSVRNPTSGEFGPGFAV